MEVRRGHGKCVRGSRCQVAKGMFMPRGTMRRLAPGGPILSGQGLLFVSFPPPLLSLVFWSDFSPLFLRFFNVLFFSYYLYSSNTASRPLSPQPPPSHPPPSYLSGFLFFFHPSPREEKNIARKGKKVWLNLFRKCRNMRYNVLRPAALTYVVMLSGM